TNTVDRLTQTQNSIDDLVRIMYSSLSYLSRKASFKQINPNFPVTQSIPGADSQETYQENRKELVGDFLRKAKQLEYLISVLPSPPPPPPAAPADSAAAAPPPQNGTGTGDGDEAEFARLEQDLQSANDEYLDALQQAGESSHHFAHRLPPPCYKLTRIPTTSVRTQTETLHAQLQNSLQGVLESRTRSPTRAPEAPA
ncbi:hypothetical protein RHOSPDRAFT_22736, partial [Rhodotorula sp. JG-1b]